MKTILRTALLCGALVCAALPLRAQLRAPVTLLSAGNVLTGTTSNYLATAVCSLADYAGINVSFHLDAAGTDNVVLSLAKSADGAVFETTPSVTVTVAANGTNTVNAFSSATVQGAYALRLVSIAGSTNANTTNIVVKVFPKNFLR